MEAGLKDAEMTECRQGNIECRQGNIELKVILKCMYI